MNNGIKLLNRKEFTRDMKRTISRYRTLTQKNLAKVLETARSRASERIIERKDPFTKNPYHLSLIQPPVTGRLTSRTGKLKYMMENKGNIKYWRNFGKVIAKNKTAGLAGSVKVNKENRGTNKETYEATWKTSIGSDSRLFRRVKNGRKETKRTLVMRFMWEHRDRPLFKPIENTLDADMTRLFERKISEVNRRL